ncbi:hypothetical protein [Rufibacter latericius]|uniref:Glycosyltransferase RgtA/B/C/D-like domain-containing protein n=1 Tax=Rufibacter latericius TaxID=2487040 RepID=A0A3M9MM39_9BACT|nr:hypothetical protein [Rufibacter latericius]RNI25748.1 hypothetical protein EFB08_12910 [Rufibacter latericius]
MELKDLFFTPIYLIIIYIFAYQIRPKVTNRFTKKYFIPALTLKIIGSIAVGLIYFYYYRYGDTLRYLHYSRVISSTFWNEPYIAIKLLTIDLQETDYNLTKYFSNNYFFRVKDEGSFLIVRLTGLIGIFNNHSYFAIAVVYGALSFIGIWALYTTFVKMYPLLYKNMAIACLFFPSLFFWGSGILKDSLTIGALGYLMLCIYNIFIKKTRIISSALIAIICSWLIISIKIYILLCFIPGAAIWIFTSGLDKGKRSALKSSIRPLLIIVILPVALLLMGKVAENDKRYALENLESTAQTTAEWIKYSSGESGSSYSLGDDFDLSLTGLLKKLPLAINVTLFRPYLWEAKNPVMLLSALESLFLMLITIRTILKVGIRKLLIFINNNSLTLFLAIFSLSFAFAVGFSTYNFGTLARYKIPCIPFYLALIYICQFENRKIPVVTKQGKVKARSKS